MTCLQFCFVLGACLSKEPTTRNRPVVRGRKPIQTASYVCHAV